MTRFLDSLAGTLAGLLLGVILVAAIAPGAWVAASPSPSVGSHPALGRQAVGSQGAPAGSSPATAHTAGSKAAPVPAVAPPLPTAGTISGMATWYAAGPGQAAAGPALRAALPDWRGQFVVVTSGSRRVVVRLTDWCLCGDRHGLPTLIDLDRRSFAALGAPDRGVLPVVVQPIPAPPVTSTVP